VAKILTKPKAAPADPALLDDEHLVELFRETRDPKHFEILVRRYQRELFAYLARYIGDSELAEDAFQATFITVHDRLETFQPGRRFRPWLYAVAVNKTIDLKRYHRRRQAVSLDAPLDNKSSGREWSGAEQLVSREMEPFAAVSKEETAARVRQVIAQMSESTQQLLNMVYFQGMKYADVGEALGIPIGTVKSRVFNAMIKLNDTWRRMYPDQTPEQPT
jgi:RNA polymerase sigma-70 factor, ECF subfamily